MLVKRFSPLINHPRAKRPTSVPSATQLITLINLHACNVAGEPSCRVATRERHLEGRRPGGEKFTKLGWPSDESDYHVDIVPSGVLRLSYIQQRSKVSLHFCHVNFTFSLHVYFYLSRLGYTAHYDGQTFISINIRISVKIFYERIIYISLTQ